jgi:hypothetical protein
MSVTRLLERPRRGSRWRTVHTCRVVAGRPGHARGAVGPARQVWRPRLARPVLRRPAARTSRPWPAEGRRWSPCGSVERVRTWLAVSGGATGPRAAVGAARRVWRDVLGAEGRRSARPSGVEGDPMGPHGEREASSSFVEFHEARQICRVCRELDLSLGGTCHFWAAELDC